MTHSWWGVAEYIIIIYQLSLVLGPKHISLDCSTTLQLETFASIFLTTPENPKNRFNTRELIFIRGLSLCFLASAWGLCRGLLLSCPLAGFFILSFLSFCGMMWRFACLLSRFPPGPPCDLWRRWATSWDGMEPYRKLDGLLLVFKARNSDLLDLAEVCFFLISYGIPSLGGYGAFEMNELAYPVLEL